MHRKINVLTVILAAGLLFCSNTAAVRADWKSDGSAWRWMEENGAYAQEGWRNINNRWYYFDKDGSMATGWVKSKDKWYYLTRPGQGVEGAMLTGWIRTGDSWYYADGTGAMQTGVVSVGGKVYCLAENGAMQTGQVVLDGKAYYFNDSGAAEGAKPPVTKQFGLEPEKTADAGTVKNQSQSIVHRDTEEDDSDEDDTPLVVNPAIESVAVTPNGLQVILDKACRLALADFYVECPAGRDMTILKAETVEGQDRYRIYNLSTAAYQDNAYNLIITLKNGRKIQKSFTVNTGAPVLSDIVTIRSSDEEAEISLAADDVGILYYLAVPAKASRSAVSQNIPASGKEIKEKGEAVRIASGGRCEFTVSGLQKDQAYTIYLASAQSEIAEPVMSGTARIEAQIRENGNSSVTITEAEGVTSQEIRIVLSQPTEAPLAVSDFRVSCSRGPSRLDRVETQDNQTYRIFLPSSDHMYSYTSFLVSITFPDGSKTEKSFYGDYQWPIISRLNVIRKAEDKIEVSLNSDEPGKLYYLFGNGDKKPEARLIKETGSSVPLYAGANEFTLPVSREDAVLYILPEDNKGNIPAYVDSKEVPKETDKGEAGNSSQVISITTSNYGMGTLLKVTFKEDIEFYNLNVWNMDLVTISGGTGDIPRIVGKAPGTGKGKTMELTLNTVLAKGEYKLKIQLENETLSSTFEIN